MKQRWQHNGWGTLSPPWVQRWITTTASQIHIKHVQRDRVWNVGQVFTFACIFFFAKSWATTLLISRQITGRCKIILYIRTHTYTVLTGLLVQSGTLNCYYSLNALLNQMRCWTHGRSHVRLSRPYYSIILVIWSRASKDSAASRNLFTCV